MHAQVVWGDTDNLPVTAASHFIVQGAVTDPQDVHDLVLTVGYLPPPVFLGTPDQQREAAAAVTRVTVNPIARFSIPVARARELAQLMQNMIQAIEAQEPQP